MEKHTEAAFNQSKARGTARAVLFALCRYCDKDGNLEIAQPRLGELSGYKRVATLHAIADLVELGEIEVTENRGWPNSYKVKLESF